MNADLKISIRKRKFEAPAKELHNEIEVNRNERDRGY